MDDSTPPPTPAAVPLTPAPRPRTPSSERDRASPPPLNQDVKELPFVAIEEDESQTQTYTQDLFRSPIDGRESRVSNYGRNASIMSIPERFEHCHNEEQDEFQLIPHRGDDDYVLKYVPISFWFPRYKWKEWLLYDSLASITSTVMVIPLGMGYSMIAGLEPAHGLYTALLGHMLYPCFGTSGQMVFGPVAIVSLMTKEILHHYFPEDEHHDPQKYTAYASCLAFQVGIISLSMGLANAGSLANMLAEPVIVGFTTAAVILIGLAQMQFVFQITVVGEKVTMQLASIAKNIGGVHWYSVLLCVCCMAVLLAIKSYRDRESWPLSKYAKFVPSALIVVIAATLLSASIGTSAGFDIVGSLPNGLPGFVNFLGLVKSDDFWEMWTSSLLVTVLSFMETIVVATKFADKHDYSIDPSQELIALGMCNIIGCWFQIYPISGILSVAAVVEAAGAVTPLYSLMSGVQLLLAISFFLSAFKWLPKPVLGAIVLVGISNLMELHKIKDIFTSGLRRDFAVFFVTVNSTLVLGIEYGIMMGVGASVMMFVRQEAKPHYAILGKIETEDVTVNIYRNIKHHPGAQVRSDMLIIRWDASIFFANIESFKKRIRKHIGRFLFKQSFPEHYCLVLCFSGVNDIDYSGIEKLKEFFIELKLKEKGLTLLIVKLKEHLKKILKKSGILEIIGEDHILYELHEAEDWWNRRTEQFMYL